MRSLKATDFSNHLNVLGLVRQLHASKRCANPSTPAAKASVLLLPVIITTPCAAVSKVFERTSGVQCRPDGNRGIVDPRESGCAGGDITLPYLMQAKPKEREKGDVCIILILIL